MKWAHLDEAYTWGPWLDGEAPLKSLRRSSPEQYARVPNALFDRLKKAWAEVDAVAAEVAKFAGKEQS